jgi:UDP-GlcNAc:undecaprenyl-phosphate GlcNAc-1-phosphate transferase
MIAAAKLRIIAIPNAESRHNASIPLLGGAPIIIAILLALALLDALPLWTFGGAIGLLGVGLVDDAIALRPISKLILEAAAVVTATVLWRAPALAPWPILSDGLIVFWLLATVNAFNLIDGLDGLAGGIGIAAATAITLVGVVRHDGLLACQALAIAGALGGFLIFNLYPASIFMGDAGALPLGFLLGAIALNAGPIAADSSWLARYLIPILIMLAPLLDMTIVTISRMLTSQPVTRRGLDHSHHKLLALGLPDSLAVRLCWSVAAVAGACAVALATMAHAYVVAALPFIAALLGVLAFFMIDLTFDAGEPGAAYPEVHGLARALLIFGYKRRLTEVALDFTLIVAAYLGAFLIRFDFVMTDERMAELLPNLPYIAIASYVAFLLCGVYRGMWRYTGLFDLVRFANAALAAGALALVASYFLPIMMSGSTTVLFVILLLNLLAGSRLSFKALRKGIALLEPPRRRVVIVGAGPSAEAAARYLTSGHTKGMKIVGFVDGDPLKVGRVMHGMAVLGTIAELVTVQRATRFNEIMLATDAGGDEQATIASRFASRHGLPIASFAIVVNELTPEINTTAASRGQELLHGEMAIPKNLLA